MKQKGLDAEARIQAILKDRTQKGLLRRLTYGDDLIDFSSNDYLGFARFSILNQLAKKFLTQLEDQKGTIQISSSSSAASDFASASNFNVASILGSTGSRLLSGNSKEHEEIESFITKFHEADAGLLFNSGFDANCGFFGCVPQHDDLVLYDILIHASVHEGMRVGKGKSVAFKHNDTVDLEQHIVGFLRGEGNQSNRPGAIFVAIETVYSMDGDLAPLEEMVNICEKYGAHLVVDEAHATGVYGPKGSGRAQQLNVHRKIFARLHTFGKGLGCHGAIILGSKDLRSYLINYARPLIYSTSLPIHSLLSVYAAYHLLLSPHYSTDHLFKLIARFREHLSVLPQSAVLPSLSPIQGVIVQGNQNVVELANELRAAGFDVKPIRSPTVPVNTERVRICIHAHNTFKEIEKLCFHIIQYFSKRGDISVSASQLPISAL